MHVRCQAQDEYQKALSLLEKRDTQPDIWDSITWELSSTYFTMAMNLQDFAPLSTMAQEQVGWVIFQRNIGYRLNTFYYNMWILVLKEHARV